MVILLGAGKGMTEIKSEYRCETCAFFIGKMENFFKVDQPFCKNPKMIEYFKSLPKDPGVSKDGKSSWLSQDVIRKGDLWFAPLSHSDIERNSVLGCLGHSAMIEQKPSYKDLVDHIRWTQNLWRHGIEIMRKNNLVIASDTPMEKLAFTFYNDLCEIDWRALHLFGEGPGDENYKDQSAIQTQGIVPYPRPYEEAIKQAAEKCGYERGLKERLACVDVMAEIEGAREDEREKTLEKAEEEIYRYQRHHIGMNETFYKGMTQARDVIKSLYSAPMDEEPKKDGE